MPAGASLPAGAGAAAASPEHVPNGHGTYEDIVFEYTVHENTWIMLYT
jgi:hypothetical protein